jgi:predicted DNA-binding ribbon-helix-helix protein
LLSFFFQKQEADVQTVIVKRSIVIAGHKTSVSLEDAFWNSLKEIGRSQEVTLSELVSDIDTRRLNGNLSSAIRLFVLDHYQKHSPRESANRIMEIGLQQGESLQANGGSL